MPEMLLDTTSSSFGVGSLAKRRMYLESLAINEINRASHKTLSQLSTCSVIPALRFENVRFTLANDVDHSNEKTSANHTLIHKYRVHFVD